jgi:hypothetical protein
MVFMGLSRSAALCGGYDREFARQSVYGYLLTAK